MARFTICVYWKGEVVGRIPIDAETSAQALSLFDKDETVEVEEEVEW